MVGTTPMYSTIRSYYDDDVRLIIVLTLVVVFLILVLLLRAIVAPLYLIASVVISYLSAVGVGVCFFQFMLHQPIYWNVPGDGLHRAGRRRCGLQPAVDHPHS